MTLPGAFSNLSKLQRERLIAVLLIGLFVALSLFSIMDFSVWHDESYSATLIESSYTDIVRRTAYDVHPPFYYLVLKAWSGLFGESVLALRAMSLTFMTGAIMVAWRLLRRQFGVRAGLYALTGMATGPFLIRYSQEMRMYGLGAFLAMSATYLLWRLYTDELSRRKVQLFTALYVLLASAALYTHYFLAFMLVAHAFFVIRPTLKTLKPNVLIRTIQKLPIRWKLAFSLPVLSLVPWLPAMLDQFREVHGSFWIGPMEVKTLTSTIINFFLFRQQWELSGWMAILGFAALASAITVLLGWYGKRGEAAGVRNARRLALTLLIVPIALLVLISLPPFQPAYQDRYVSFYAPILYGTFAICLAHGLTVKRGAMRKTAALVMVVSILWGIVNVSMLGNNQGWRPEPHFTINQMASYADTVHPGAPVVSTTLWTFLDAHVTLGDSRDVRLYAPDGVGKYGNGSVMYDREELMIKDLDSIKGDHVWILQEAGRPDPDVPAAWQQLQAYQSGYAKIVLYATN